MHPLCLWPDDDVDTALETMRNARRPRVPVVDNGVAVGVVSLGDLARLRDPGVGAGPDQHRRARPLTGPDR